MLELARLPTECEAICFEAGERNWKIQPLQYTFPTLQFFCAPEHFEGTISRSSSINGEMAAPQTCERTLGPDIWCRSRQIFQS